MRITPGGGTSLADARSRHERSRASYGDALARFGLRDLDHAGAIHEERRVLEARIAGSEARWEALGGSQLAGMLAEATNVSTAAAADLDRRRSALEDAPPPPVDLATAYQERAATAEQLQQAERTEEAVARSLAGRRSHYEDARKALQAHLDALTDARQDLRDLEAEARICEESAGDGDARRRRMAETAAARQAADDDLAATRAALAARVPERVEADLARFRRAIEQQEARRREAEDQRLVARNRLASDGTSDPRADLARALARRQEAAERLATEDRRGAAIALLHRLFSEGRDAIYQNLAQPLADRISGYLECLFGAGTEIRVTLTDEGIEGLDLIRPGDPAFGFDALSGGAREQVAAAVRLAMAEILAAGHDDCLPVVFDDAFAFTDPTRIASLQRMLDLAAQRGLQVIVLSCTPGDYSGLGAKVIRLG